jgi:hypothetical protein
VEGGHFAPQNVGVVPAFHAVPNRSEKVDPSFTFRRFPMLKERPSFYAGTQSPRPWSGNWRELFIHLTIGTFFTFIMAVILFCLIPRVGQIDFYDYTLKSGFENWFRPVRQQISVGTVGINEEIQLGSLGSVIPHHREVIKVRFLHDSDNQLVIDTVNSTNSYQKIAGATLYFRGIPLDTYSMGAWVQRPPLDSAESSAESSVAGGFRMGAILQPQNQQRIFFEEDCDLVTLAMEIQVLETQVFFAPHPFFSLQKQREVELRSANGRVEEGRPRRRAANKTIVSAAFKQGVQLELIPCQEEIDHNTLTQFPDRGLESLKALAVQWDRESGHSKNNVIERARYIEQKLLNSEEFSYQLGGTLRDYDLDPLEDFIAHNPKGHCEYFASALALMLRSVGIPCRVIVGFKTEADNFSATCVIRQSDAHTWVEVYIPPEAMPLRTTGNYAQWWQNGGWLRLDPTPASRSSTFMAALTLQWTDVSRWIQSLWDEFVLNMNPGKQTLVIYQPLYQAGEYILYQVFNYDFWREFCSDMVQYYWSFFTEVPQQERRMWDGYYWIPPIVLLGLLALAFWRLVVMLRSSKHKYTAEEMRRRITIEFYLRMERMLTKIGQIRNPAVTPLEFARQSSLPSSFSPLMLPVVDAFYRVRFGNAVLTDEESKSILNTLDRLERSVAEHEQK